MNNIKIYSTMNTRFKLFGYGIFLIAIVIACTSCEKEDRDFLSESVDMLQVDPLHGYSRINYSFARTTINNLPYENLNIKEEKGIGFIRESDKLAMDFYATMFAKWGHNVFENLRISEASHFRASDLLIDKYVMLDPCENKDVGEFPTNSLQAFYNYLILEGNKSITDAYKSSILLGESELVTLRDQLTSITNNTDLRLFYHNLVTAARNHFRITVKQYEKQGATYTPVILDPDDYFEIINSGWEMEAGE